MSLRTSIKSCVFLYGLSAGILIAGLGCFNPINSVVTGVSKIAQDGDLRNGITYYVGGAGPIGHVGSLDVPMGLQDAGYDGYVKVFSWQGWTHAGDQMSLAKNREKATELAAEIRNYAREYPGKKINIVALSAGTGIAAFALEFIPERIQVQNVVFLGCSLSSRYDLTRALRRVRGNLYCVYSPSDVILKDIVWYTGTVDRSKASEGIAGLEGFRRPSTASSDMARQYAKLQNVACRPEFADVGYRGGHTDCTSRGFVSTYLAGTLMGLDRALAGGAARSPRPVTRDASPPVVDRTAVPAKRTPPRRDPPAPVRAEVDAAEPVTANQDDVVPAETPAPPNNAEVREVRRKPPPPSVAEANEDDWRPPPRTDAVRPVSPDSDRSDDSAAVDPD